MDIPAILQQLRDDVHAELTARILPFHIKHMVRPEGGFYGAVSNDLVVDGDAPRGLIQCTRILWTYARAYRLFGRSEYLQTAAHAYRDLNNSFLDREHGGYFWLLKPDGRPLERFKRIYGQAYAIFALSELHRVTGNSASLEQALALFRLLEAQAVDAEQGGYWEWRTADWQPSGGPYPKDSLKTSALKSVNTHLHVLEAYSNLLSVWDDKTLRQRQRAVIDLHERKIIDPESGQARLHFDRGWRPLDSPRSFGHDIETSWLLWEAAEVLGDQVLQDRVRPLVIKMAEPVLDEALDDDGGLLSSTNDAGGAKIWWEQAEALVGFLNAYQLTGEPRFLEAVLAVWRFIQKKIVDREHGEWLWGLDRNDKPLSMPLAGSWKTPYHNGRACFELLRRLDEIQE